MRRQTEKKIETIIKSNFEPEIAKKHQEIDSIDEVRIHPLFFFFLKCTFSFVQIIFNYIFIIIMGLHTSRVFVMPYILKKLLQIINYLY